MSLKHKGSVVTAEDLDLLVLAPRSAPSRVSPGARGRGARRGRDPGSSRPDPVRHPKGAATKPKREFCPGSQEGLGGARRPERRVRREFQPGRRGVGLLTSSRGVKGVSGAGY